MTPREIAILNKEPYYNTGKPCKNGHTMARYTISAVCVQCNRDRSKRNANMIRENLFKVGLGLKQVICHVHPHDEKTVESFVKALLFDRGIY